MCLCTFVGLLSTSKCMFNNNKINAIAKAGFTGGSAVASAEVWKHSENDQKWKNLDGSVCL